MVNEQIFNILGDSIEQIQKTNFRFKGPINEDSFYQPNFSSINLSSMEEYMISAKNGGIFESKILKDPVHKAQMRVRIGDYEKGGSEGHGDIELPRDLDETAFRAALWANANACFWLSIEDYGKMLHNTIGSLKQRDNFSYFSKEKPNSFMGEERLIDIDFRSLEDILRDVSKKLYDKSVLSSELEFKLYKENKYFINSEGSKIFTSSFSHFLRVGCSTPDSEGRILDNSKMIYGTDLFRIPSSDSLIQIGEELKREIGEIKKCRIQENGEFPVLMDPINHGVLWHETSGHALEADGMQSVDEDQDICNIFLEKLGKRVAPEFLSLYDDPTDEKLYGSFMYDDEGVKSQRVELIKDGILKNYLHSRESAGFFKTKSNGHARAESGERPTPRMSNLIVKSSNEAPIEQLKEDLIKECEKFHHEYGLIFEGSVGGLTLPSESSFKTFPKRVFRLYRDGKEEQVRGIYIVGTPYQAISKIIKTGNVYGSDCGYCGAESGSIPVSECAQHALTSSLEVNRVPDSSYEIIKKLVVPRP